MRKVELYEIIRKKHYLERGGIRALAREFGVHRRTVRQALADAVPPPRKAVVREPVVLTAAHRGVVDEWLRADQQAPRKQRHTARRIAERLRREHGYLGSEPTVRRYVSVRRRELGVGRGAFVPRYHAPGEEAEVDWYEAEVDFPHGRETAQFFAMRSCYSGREFHMAFPRATQQALLEGHAGAFAFFAGVFRRARYDNLTSAVSRILRGRKRQETERFVALRSHYLFEAEFCRPGVEGAHEKGGVEGGLGRFRRNELVPVPQMESYEALNEFLLAACQARGAQRMEGRARTIDEEWLDEQPHLLPLPEAPLDTSETSVVRVDAMGRVCVRTNRYSVLIALAHRRVEVRLGARRVDVVHEGRQIATHARLYGRHQEQLALDHYLELLREKPGALAGSRPLRQARDAGSWPPEYDKLWSALRERWGDASGTRQLVDVLMLHRAAPRDAVDSAVGLALAYGCLDSAAIQLLLHQLQNGERRPAPLDDLGELHRYERPAASLHDYDALLHSQEVH